jgi:hypothetical protein
LERKFVPFIDIQEPLPLKHLRLRAAASASMPSVSNLDPADFVAVLMRLSLTAGKWNQNMSASKNANYKSYITPSTGTSSSAVATRTA